MRPAIEFRGVRFTYDGEDNALEDIDLAIESGEYVCIVGGNGSGKSTLARHINGLLLPDEGEVLVLGSSTRDASHLLDIRSSVGMVFQNPDDQLVASIVENEIAFGPENRGLPSEGIRRQVSHALEVVGMEGFEKHRVDELSGGQKQRVAIAGALALNPKILVLDEATAMLDPMGKVGFLRVIDRLNALGMTIVMITHDLREARKANRCIVLERGRIVGDYLEAQYGILPTFEGEAPLASPLKPLRLSAEAKACVQDETAANKAELAGGLPSKATAQRNRNDFSNSVISVIDVSYSYEKVPRHRSLHRRREHPESDTPRWGSDPNASWALSGLAFYVRAAEIFGIAGHTGSGKSTLLQLMCGLKQATSGKVLLEGDDLSDKRIAREACRRVGLVFQYPEYQLFAPTVEEDIAFGPRNLGLSEDEVSRLVNEALDLVGLPTSLLARSPFELSDGQQRRVALAGVISMRPEVLVLDEPVAGLDFQGKQHLLSLIERLRASGKTIVLVSHCMEDLASLCTRVLVLNQGSVHSLGTPQEVFSDKAKLQAIGLDVPNFAACGAFADIAAATRESSEIAPHAIDGTCPSTEGEATL